MGFPDKYSIGAYVRSYPALAPVSATGGTAITANQRILDRNAVNSPGSSALIISGTYTVASGAAGDFLTVAGVINSAASTSSGSLVSPVLLKSFSVTVPWASNAAGKEFSVLVPSGFNGAYQYVQLTSLTLTPTSVGTYSALTASAVHILAGENQIPDPLYVPTGFVSFSN